MKRIFIALFLFVPLFLQAQIKSGPMLGYSEMKEVLVWVQTEKAADVSIQYWEKGDKTIHKTEPIHTEKSTAYIARIIADEVSMGKKYEYEVLVNGKKMAFDYTLEFQGIIKRHFFAVHEHLVFVFLTHRNLICDDAGNICRRLFGMDGFRFMDCFITFFPILNTHVSGFLGLDPN